MGVLSGIPWGTVEPAEHHSGEAPGGVVLLCGEWTTAEHGCWSQTHIPRYNIRGPGETVRLFTFDGVTGGLKWPT